MFLVLYSAFIYSYFSLSPLKSVQEISYLSSWAKFCLVILLSRSPHCGAHGCHCAKWQLSCSWSSILRKLADQFKNFTYLGIWFSADLFWTPQLGTALHKAKPCANTINRFFHKKGGGGIFLERCKLLIWKWSPLFFMAQLSGLKLYLIISINLVQLLRKILNIPCCVSNVFQTEFGQLSLEERAGL